MHRASRPLHKPIPLPAVLSLCFSRLSACNLSIPRGFRTLPGKDITRPQYLTRFAPQPPKSARHSVDRRPFTARLPEDRFRQELNFRVRSQSASPRGSIGAGGWNGELRFRWQGLGKGRQAPCRAAKVSVQGRWSGSGRRGSRSGGGQAERARVSHRWQEEAPEAAQEASQGDGRGEGGRRGVGGRGGTG